MALRSVLKADCDAVPGVHDGDGIGDVRNLLLIVVPRQRFVCLVRSMSQLDPSQRLRPFERRFLSIGKIRALAPTREAIKALVWFSCGSQISRMFVDTVGAIIDLRYAEEKKIP